VAVAHFANPPHLMPLVEVVPGPETRPGTLTRLSAFLATLGKETVELSRDLPGHLFNRLQFAMLREAMALVAGGVATPAQIDRVVKRGLALRLAEEGPMEKMDLAGLELVRDVARYLFPDLDAARTPDLLERMLSEGRRGADWGAGFHDWTPARADELRRRRNAEVVRQLTRTT
jgi:3-hydroxybutyryl-CoA dehydrogenase